MNGFRFRTNGRNKTKRVKQLVLHTDESITLFANARMFYETINCETSWKIKIFNTSSSTMCSVGMFRIEFLENNFAFFVLFYIFLSLHS